VYYTNIDMFDHPTWCIYYLGHHYLNRCDYNTSEIVQKRRYPSGVRQLCRVCVFAKRFISCRDRGGGTFCGCPLKCMVCAASSSFDRRSTVERVPARPNIADGLGPKWVSSTMLARHGCWLMCQTWPRSLGMLAWKEEKRRQQRGVRATRGKLRPVARRRTLQ